MKKKLIEQRKAALARCEELSTLAGTRELTVEERSEFDAALTRSKQLKAQIAQAEELEAEQADQVAAEARAAASRETRSDQQTRRPGATSVHDNQEDAPWGSLGEFMIAVRGAAEDRSVMDPRLRRHDVRNSQVRAAAGHNENIAADGGFLVGTDQASTLMNAAIQKASVWPLADEIPVSSNGLTYPTIDETSRVDGSRWGGVQAYWANEADSVTAKKAKFGATTLKLEKLMGTTYMTDELLADAPACEAWVRKGFAQEFSFKLDDAAIRGTGVGVPLGIMTAPCMIQVSKESGQANGTILYQNVSKMRARLLPGSFTTAVWFINQDCQTQLEKMFVPYTNVAGTENVGGMAVYMPPTGATAQPYGTLFGRPVIPIEQCETLGTAGDIILADMQQYLTISKGGLQTASSVHVNFLTDETAFRFIVRVNGQPKFKSAITPYKGTNTMSAFVKLQAR